MLSGKSIVDGFVRGMRSAIGAVRSAANAVVSAARGFFPFSPAKEGPFSGKGYTTHSGRALVKDWAKGIESAMPYAVSAVDDMMSLANKTATAEWNGHIASDGFGNMNVNLDGELKLHESGGKIMAKIVNKENRLQEVRKRING